MATRAETERGGASLWRWWALCALVLVGLVLGVFVPALLVLVALLVLMVPVLAARQARDRRRLDDAAGEELEKALAQAEGQRHRADLLGGVIDGADIPIIATDALGALTHINDRAGSVLGIGQSMLGRRFDELMPQGVLHELESLARRDEPGHARVGMPVHGEMRDFDVSADPVPGFDGAVVTFRDITELSRAMTLKTDFVANASHELRTPIASIKAAAETLSGPARHDEEMAARLIEMISANAGRLELLASDLLDLSRVEREGQAPETAMVDLGALIGRVVAELAPAGERRGLEIVVELGDGLGAVRSDGALLMLILRNLLGNAVKFAREGTKVRVVAQRRDIAPDRATPIPAAMDLAWGLRLSVIDKGIGIPLPHQQRVFERFYQVDEARTGSGARRGTGLGLAIVKHAARRLGGTVWLESVYQIGTSVGVDLPRCVASVDGEDALDPLSGGA